MVWKQEVWFGLWACFVRVLGLFACLLGCVCVCVCVCVCDRERGREAVCLFVVEPFSMIYALVVRDCHVVEKPE